VTTRFVTYAVPLDAAASAYVEAVTSLPAMRQWATAAAAEPAVIEYPVFRRTA
jgi:glutathione S-transferase